MNAIDVMHLWNGSGAGFAGVCLVAPEINMDLRKGSIRFVTRATRRPNSRYYGHGGGACGRSTDPGLNLGQSAAPVAVKAGSLKLPIYPLPMFSIQVFARADPVASIAIRCVRDGEYSKPTIGMWRIWMRPVNHDRATTLFRCQCL